MWGSVHIGRIVRVSRMLTRWRKKAAKNKNVKRVPADVPPGHVAVVVGETRRRFVVRAKYLNYPIFQNLLSKAEDEFGFEYNDGPVFFPCDVAAFEDALRVVTRSADSVPTRCRASSESLPLIRPEKPLC